MVKADIWDMAGDVPRVLALFDRVVAIANDLDLLAEEYDSGAGRQAGRPATFRRR